MTGRAVRNFAIPILAVGLVLAGCGAGDQQVEGQAPPPAGATVLAWDPPATYADNAALDPFQDIDYYEIYVRQDENFADADLPLAQIAAVSSLVPPGGSAPSQELVREFVLENLAPFVTKGQHYFVSIKAVGSDGQRSAFMQPVPWDSAELRATL